MSEQKYLNCDWCGCDAWQLRNKYVLTCDCGRTLAFVKSPLKPLTETQIELIIRFEQSSAEEKQRFLNALIDFAHSCDDEVEE